MAWRLLLDPAEDGVWNMAVDEALLASVQAGGPPTVRLYAWRGSWLSLGYGQTLPAHRAEACRRAGVGVVRRVTGGSAVLHGEDLTYAVAAPDGALPAGLRASYGLVCAALLHGLSHLGVAAVAAGSAPRTPRHPAPFDCFARAGEDEICAGGRKLAGSAQRRTNGGMLQHGSLRLSPDPWRATRAAGLVPGAATSLQELGAHTSADAVRAAVVAGFEAVLGSSLVPGALHEDERRHALTRTQLLGEKPRATPLPVGPVPSRPPPARR